MNRYKARLYFIGFLITTLACAMVTRLFIIQIVEGERYAARSRDQSQQRRILPAHRGDILDRKGRVLAAGMKGNLKPDAIGIQLRDEKVSPVKDRVYPLGTTGGSLIGYVGRDGYGLGGVEFAFDNYLHGENGWTMIQKDGRNVRYRKIGMPYKDPRDGGSVYLTIDINIEKIVQTVLKQAVEAMKAKGGMCIMMEPRSGKILAMADEPSFDPNIPSQYSLAERSNKCISMIYEPGSTFKLVTASAALQEGLKKESDLIDGNNGKYEIYDQVIRDHEPYGYLTFVKALAYSSNVCFAKIANDIGNERLYRYARDFGFGVRTGIDLPGEENGIVHQVREWSGRTRVTMAIGQEVSVTLLQMMLAFSAVANGGVLVAPRIYEKVTDCNGTAVLCASEYKPVRRILSVSSARRLTAMLRTVVEDGTGKNAGIQGVSVAGKTGTSQKPDSGTYSRSRQWSSFIGFLPADNPLLICGVVIDEPANAEMGAVAAAPVFKKIMSQIISHPELEFAEKILHINKTVPQEAPSPETPSTTVPVVAGLTRKTAEKLLDAEHIRYSFVGKGSSITFQAPAPGMMLPADGRLVLYLDADGIPAIKGMLLPDCQGRDLRDAVNLLNHKGLVPFVVGAGLVRKQQPLPGSLVRPAEVCTLYCSFQG